MEAIPESVAVAVERQLAMHGILLHGDVRELNRSNPVPIALEVDGQDFHTAALYLPEMSATTALKAAQTVPSDLPLFVVGPRIHASSADTMRTGGIWYADDAGNAHLRGRGLLVDVRGRRGPTSLALSRQDKSGPANPFTPKRAQVVFVLLIEPTLVDAPLREIAEKSGVSLGMTKGTIDALEHIGFVEQLGSHRRLIRRSQLLDLWASAYPTGLGRSNRLIVASGETENWSAAGNFNVAVSGEHAVPALIRNPKSLVIYVDGDRDKGSLRGLMLTNRWHNDPHGNIIIRDLFWRDLPPANQPDTAPVALIYADLLASHEPRQLEVAGEMRRNDDRLVEL